MTFTKDQPKRGDRIVSCGHHKASSYHFFKSKAPFELVLPTGEKVDVPWLVQCHACYITSGDSPIIKACFTWGSDEPTVKEEEKH